MGEKKQYENYWKWNNYQLDTKLAALPCNKLLHMLWKHNFTVHISSGVGTKDKKYYKEILNTI